MGFDGQYFNLGIPGHLTRLLNLDNNVNFGWDWAHKLQLCETHAQKSNLWIEPVCDVINEVLKKFSFGKCFEKALEIASNMDVDLKALLWWSNTRFAAYENLMFENFLDNYPVLRKVLEDIARSNDRKADDACSILKHMTTVDFVCKLLICKDFYRAIANTSKLLQKVDFAAWSKVKDLENLIVQLERRNTFDANEPIFTTFTSKCKTIQEECVFGGYPLFIKETRLDIPGQTTRQEKSQKEVKDARAIVDRSKTTASSLARAMAKQIKREEQPGKPARFPQSFFKEMKEKEKSASLLPAVKISRTSPNKSEFLKSASVHALLRKHPTRREGVLNLRENIYREREALMECSTDFDIYHKIFMLKCLYTGAHHLLSHIAKVICSDPVESVVESMGSIVESIRKTRGGRKYSQIQSTWTIYCMN